MQGESGTSKSGKVKYYYKCGKRKKFNTCKKAALPKEQLENLIVKIIHHMLDEPKNIDYLASEIIKANRNHLSQQSVLNTLIRERDDLQKALSNIIKAIEQGLINDTMKKRMNELEEQIKILEDKITVEEYKKQKELSYENVVAYLQKAIQLKPKPLILTLIQKIVVMMTGLRYSLTIQKKIILTILLVRIIFTQVFDLLRYGGDKRTRTVHLLNAIQALYQMSYIPVLLFAWCGK